MSWFKHQPPPQVVTLVSTPETWDPVLQNMAPELSEERFCPEVDHFVSLQKVLHILFVEACGPGKNIQYCVAHCVFFTPK